MTGEKNLDKLLKTMNPKLNMGDFVFCTVLDITTIAFNDIILMFREEEGYTIILKKEIADNLKLEYSFVASWITLTVHSSLEAVGLTAAFSKALSDEGISCNVIAGYYHDHLFVDKKDMQKAMEVLNGKIFPTGKQIDSTYLFFDTETTGLPLNWKAPVTDLNNWPRLVQLAYLYFDSNGNKISGGNFIIKPEGFTIPPDVVRIHGISNERANKEGIPLETVLQDFQSMISQAGVLVAHNMKFDEKIVGAEFLRAGMQNLIPSKRKICTMESSSNFCAIKGPYGYKWPKLSELHYKLFRTGFEEAHNAAVDITATAKCFWELKRIGRI
jgi:DNA polymerase III subunit epsilon